ncbi:MAG: DegT/DnrJ/EryC1/StrS family aminotransferase, partial [Solibacillus sp.]
TEEIERIAKKYNLKVIYDAAHAFGITINGKSIANFGDASMFSFHATKVFHTIEGGALTYKNTDMSTYINALKNFGITGPENVEYVGGNAKMNEFQAAMGLCNLRNLEKEIDSRKLVFERYVEQLSYIEGIKISLPSKNIQSNYAYLPILFDNISLSRDEIYNLLLKENIHTRKYFYPLSNELTYSKEKNNSNGTPVAQKISRKILTLPIYADLHLDDVDRICQTIKTKLVLS